MHEAVVLTRLLYVRLLVFPGVVVAEAVDPNDVMAVGEQPLAEMRADEPRSAGDYNSAPNSRHLLRVAVAFKMLPLSAQNVLLVRGRAFSQNPRPPPSGRPRP